MFLENYDILNLCAGDWELQRAVISLVNEETDISSQRETDNS